MHPDVTLGRTANRNHTINSYELDRLVRRSELEGEWPAFLSVRTSNKVEPAAGPLPAEILKKPKIGFDCGIEWTRVKRT